MLRYNNMKILILGAKGMLGRDLSHVFQDAHPLLWDRDELDITDEKAVRRKLERERPEVIINAAAYTDVDGAETDTESAMEINAEAVKYIADVAASLPARLVHYSTDYVFEGIKEEGYREDDIPIFPINFYGKSKMLGERYVLNTAKNRGLHYFLIRTSWLFGPLRERKEKERNFVGTILELTGEKDEIRVVDDQWGRPTLTNDLAVVTKTLLSQDFPSGIYHVTNSTPEKGITRYEFAKKILELKGKKTRILPCSTRDLPRPAPRPHHTVLINTKFPPLRLWGDALKEYLDHKL